jgi:hypothetical protein
MRRKRFAGYCEDDWGFHETEGWDKGDFEASRGITELGGAENLKGLIENMKLLGRYLEALGVLGNLG